MGQSPQPKQVTDISPGVSVLYVFHAMMQVLVKDVAIAISVIYFELSIPLVGSDLYGWIAAFGKRIHVATKCTPHGCEIDAASIKVAQNSFVRPKYDTGFRDHTAAGGQDPHHSVFSYTFSEVVAGSDVTEIVSGNGCVFAITRNGYYTRGYNGHGQLGCGDTDLRVTLTYVSMPDIITMICGKVHVMVLLRCRNEPGGSGCQVCRVYGWGYNYCNQIGLTSNDRGIVSSARLVDVADPDAIACGVAYSLILASGYVYLCGQHHTSPVKLGFDGVTSIHACCGSFIVWRGSVMNHCKFDGGKSDGCDLAERVNALNTRNENSPQCLAGIIVAPATDHTAGTKAIEMDPANWAKLVREPTMKLSCAVQKILLRAGRFASEPILRINGGSWYEIIVVNMHGICTMGVDSNDSVWSSVVCRVHR